MNNTTEEKKFKKMIFEKFGQDKNFDHLKLNIMNVRQTMLEEHACFKKMSLKKQFEYCATIGTIAIQTVLQHMNENRPLTFPEDKRYKFSIDRDWKKVECIELKN